MYLSLYIYIYICIYIYIYVHIHKHLLNVNIIHQLARTEPTKSSRRMPKGMRKR